MNLSTFWLLIALVAMGGWFVLNHKLFLATPSQRWKAGDGFCGCVLALNFYLGVALAACWLHYLA